ncbi:MAG TPA: F0F1 ATP synthase subunit A [Saprospiraceae bacterium]|nr:F0F1 ATP synthase subunit A [Saprospiraceae bacterium]
MKMRIILFSLLACLLILPATSFAQDHEGDQQEEVAEDHSQDGETHEGEHSEGDHEDKPYAERIIEHISDANEFHLWGDVSIPLPCILYSFEDGLSVFMSNQFHHGHSAVDGYVMNHGDVMRIKDYSEDMHVEHIDHVEEVETEDGGSTFYAHHGDEKYELVRASTLLNFTSWIDFSITKVVFTMLLTAVLLMIIWLSVARSYKKREGQAPKGMQSFFEPLFTFMRDEVVKPTIGAQYERYMPFIMSLFFFILFCNILGLIPFFPGSGNVTGNLGVTLALAVFTMVITNFSGNKHYWQHIFWMPGVPVPVRFILAPIEFAGIFIKPFTLLIRLFANITAGHIIILALVGMVFILGDNGANPTGAGVGSLISIAFVFIMNLLELLVAFIQAFLFALLSSLYIGMAVEEHEHH